jgi:glycerol kinase
VLASCAWRRAGETTYALEGFVPAAGAAVDWFARELALPAGPELDALLREGRPGPICVPVLAGFGTPAWDAAARGVIVGLGLDTTRADLARAVVDGVLHQIVDALDAMTVGTLWVDGGLSRSDWIVQRLADLGGVQVQRSPRADSTALGAAMLAGLASGVWSTPAEIPRVVADLVAYPRECDREAERGRWAAATELARSNRPRS